jgi:hypothetical protein
MYSCCENSGGPGKGHIGFHRSGLDSFTGPKKSRFSGPTPSNGPRNIFARIITINVTFVYTARDVMILMRVTSITKAIGRSMGPENRDFFRP